MFENNLRHLYPIGEEIPLLDSHELAPTLSSSENLAHDERIDFVLVYEETLDENDPFERAQKGMRKNFEANLQHYGLVLHYRKFPLKNHRQRVFVLINTPLEKLLEMCEITRTYLPIGRVNPFLHRLLNYPMPVDGHFKENDRRSKLVFYPYSKRLHEIFLRQNSAKKNLFTIAQRTRLTSEILSRMPLLPPTTKRFHRPSNSHQSYLNNTTFESLTVNFTSTARVSFSSISNDDIINNLNEFNRHPIVKILSSHRYAYGINILIKSGIYLAAYPPHEPYRTEKHNEMNTRELLWFSWAQIKHIFKEQPIELIRTYFGENVALYFVFLGWYTYMLILPSIIGCIVMSYSIMNTFFDIPTSDICNGSTISTEYLCPERTRKKYVLISNECLTKRFSTIFDNYSTHMFGIFMIFWILCLRRLWQRYLARFQYQWSACNLFEFQNNENHRISRLDSDERRHEVTRSSFLIQSTQTKINRINGIEEPFIPLWMIFFCRLFSFLLMLVFLILSILNIVLMLYIRLKLFKIFHSIQSEFWKENSSMIISIIASIISLIISVILDFMFGYFANQMTEFERHRYQSNFDASLTLKLFIFSFVNYYSYPIYTAFVKPWIPSLPLNRISGVDSYFVFTERLEPCHDLTGCSYEISVILLITLIGKQLVNSIIEILATKIVNFCYYLYYHSDEIDQETTENKDVIEEKKSHMTDDVINAERAPWQTDIYLQRLGRWQLYNEYLEIMVQYGFVAMFSIALPLAPFLALINNLFELRTDAIKLLFELRRPTGELAYTLGIWEKIFDALSKIAVLINILYLLITCDLISKLFYIYLEKKISLNEYLNYSLSYFNINHLEDDDEVLQGKALNITFCRYRDFRYDYDSPYKYQATPIYYQIRFLQWLSIFFLLIFTLIIYYLLMFFVNDKTRLIRDIRHREEILAEQELWTDRTSTIDLL